MYLVVNQRPSEDFTKCYLGQTAKLHVGSLYLAWQPDIQERKTLEVV